MPEWIRDRDHLSQVRKKHRDYFVLAFWGRFSEAAQRALRELEQFARDCDGIPVYVVDVQRVKGIHNDYDVHRVPTVLAVQNGKTVERIEGVESAQFYALHLSGASPQPNRSGAKGQRRTVIVYSGPGCPACGRLKAYLRQHGVRFREVNIAEDRHAAEQLVRRSGQMAVPQTDINGRLVVGFDQSKLDRLLAIQPERRK